MSEVFADTSFYIASMNPNDRWHEAALASGRHCRGRMVTTEYVLLELGNFFRDPLDRGLFVNAAKMLREDEKTDFVRASPELLEAGIALFGARPDKAWSLTDCISFVVMEARGITEALTLDHHFRQAGYRTLLIP